MNSSYKEQSFQLSKIKHSARNDVVDVDDDVRSTWKTCCNYQEPPCESSPKKLVDQIGEREKLVDQIGEREKLVDETGEREKLVNQIR